MIISNQQVQNLLKAYGEPAKAIAGQKTVKSGAGKQEAVKSSAGRSDEVVLSADAQEFSRIMQAVKNLPDVREDKVAELTRRVENGTYSVDAKDIAAEMVRRIIADKL